MKIIVDCRFCRRHISCLEGSVTDKERCCIYCMQNLLYLYKNKNWREIKQILGFFDTGCIICGLADHYDDSLPKDAFVIALHRHVLYEGIK